MGDQKYKAVIWATILPLVLISDGGWKSHQRVLFPREVNVHPCVLTPRISSHPSERERRVNLTISESWPQSNQFLSILRFCHPIFPLWSTNRQSLHTLNRSIATLYALAPPLSPSSCSFSHLILPCLAPSAYASRIFRRSTFPRKLRGSSATTSMVRGRLCFPR